MEHPPFAMRIDDGRDCWMTPAEAAVYTGIASAAVTRAVRARELGGVETPSGRLTDFLVAKGDLDRWVEQRRNQALRAAPLN
jgi:excisionase family DNA binding protein